VSVGWPLMSYHAVLRLGGRWHNLDARNSSFVTTKMNTILEEGTTQGNVGWRDWVQHRSS
jgi:hypothetical protein